jgi:triacylglycerol lipase
MLQIIILVALVIEVLVYWLIGMRLSYRGYTWVAIAPLIGTLAVTWRLLFALPSATLAAYTRWRHPTGAKSSRWTAAKALAKEIDARAVCYTLTQPFHQLVMADEPAGEKAGVPILLVHGYFSNRGMWWRFRRALAAAKVGPVYAITLSPLWGSIDAMLVGLRAKVDAIAAETGQSQLIIVAHSMGGLVSRAYMAERAENVARVRQFITIGSPHHGTRMASAGFGQCVYEMRVGSAWIAALEGAEQGIVHPPTLSIYTVNDDLVVPAESAQLSWAENVATEGMGHVGLLFSKSVAQQVIAKIRHGASQSQEPDQLPTAS